MQVLENNELARERQPIRTIRSTYITSRVSLECNRNSGQTCGIADDQSRFAEHWPSHWGSQRFFNAPNSTRAVWSFDPELCCQWVNEEVIDQVSP